MMGNRKWTDGSITVFLSLTMLIITALLGTMTEVARGKACRVYSRRTLRTAVDSLMTEYSRPLYDRYHLFFIENGGRAFPQSIARYAAKTLNPDTLAGERMDLYDGVLTDVTVEKERYAGEDGAAALQEQIMAYTKRTLAADAVQKLLGKTEVLEQLDKSAEEIDRKVREEREAAQESQTVLELMRLIDGVDCSGGSVKGQQTFVKMFFHGKKQPERFGITESIAWDAVKGNIVELQVYFSRIPKSVKMRQQFEKLVCDVEEKTRKAIKIAEEIGPRLHSYKISGDVIAVLKSNLSVLEQTGEHLKQPLTDENMSALKQLWKKYNTSGIVFDYAGINEKGGADNPMNSFSNAIAGGLSKLVWKQDAKISKKSVKNPDRYRKLYAKTIENTNVDTGQLNLFIKKEEVNLGQATKGISKALASDIMMCGYMKKYFSSVVQFARTEEKRLDYEWEYIMCGGTGDEQNLNTVINRMVLFRSVINITALLASASKRNTAYTAALGVVGFTGMEPLVRFTQTLFLILWGMVEALVDVAALLQGKKLSVVKTSKDIVVKFSELYKISNRYIMEKVSGLPKTVAQSLGYSEHLMLLMMGTGLDKKCYRMMDLMEWNIRDNDVPKFNFGICVDSFVVKGNFSFATKLFQLPFVQSIMNRNSSHFQQGVAIEARYTSP